ncbi:MAG: lipid A lauroyl acyltransferase [Nitrospinaceae bacterium]|nr:MAG: lipid A lauroyl acyltransferase [Nitrospinaceae bacterium]
MPRKKTFFTKPRHILEYSGIQLLSLMIRPLSSRQVYRIGQVTGRWFHALSKRRVQIAAANLDIAFGDSKSPQEKNRIIRQSFIQMTVSTLQCLWLQYDSEKRVNQLFPEKPKALNILIDCLEKKRGAFILMAHYGNWEAMAMYNGYLGVMHLYSIVRPLDNPYLEKTTRAFRTRSGNGIFFRDDSPLKIVRALKNNSCVAVMMDQNTAVGGIFVDFFGKKAATPRSVALLSYKMNTPILPIFVHPDNNGTYTIEIQPELKLEKTGNKKEDVLSWTQECQKAIEAVVRKHPENWMWVHRRWKTRPPEESGNKIY